MSEYSWLSYLLFLAGFVLLVKGADFLIKGSVDIAKRFGLSEHFIGLTIVSFGTSMPEFIVSFVAAIEGNNQIAVGNVLGSNIANTLLITGICALLIAIPVRSKTIKFEIPFSIIAVLLLAIFAKISLFEGSPKNAIVLWEGFILLAFFFYFIRYSLKSSKEESEELPNVTGRKAIYSIMFILVGVAGLFFGGKWIVDSTVIIAGHFGISQNFVGLTVVAFGTSLPELVTSVIAALKRNNGIAIGNIVGSNIFNVLWILGFTSFLTPVFLNESNFYDIAVVALSGLLVIVLALLSPKRKINRISGVVLISGYIIYIIYLLFRENILL